MKRKITEEVAILLRIPFVQSLNVTYTAAYTSDVFVDKKTFSYSCLSAGQKQLN